MTRAMGLDVGTDTIGVALSDPMYLIAQPYKTIKRTSLKEDLCALQEIVDTMEVSEIIVGMPLNMNNTMGPSAQRSKSFGKELEVFFQRDVFYQDERLSTKQATDVLIQTKVRRENRKKHVDKLAAHFILQTWLDKGRR